MKKIISYAVIFVICLACLFGITACKSTSLKKMAINSFAEVRYNVFEGETSSFGITFMTGMREDPYVMDGIANPLVEFGVITLVAKDTTKNYENAEKTYSITVDFTSYGGSFEINPFDGTLVADVQKVVSDDSKISIEIKVAGTTEIVTLKNGLDEKSLNYDKALDVALKELKSDLKPLVKDNALNAEVYVKIITDLDKKFDKYYWYVAFLDRDGGTIAVIIDPATGELVAKKSE